MARFSLVDSLPSVLGVPRNNIARLNADGTLDLAFNPNSGGNIFSIALQEDGKILVGGYFFNIGGQNRNKIARLDATTGLPDSFNPDAGDEVSIQSRCKRTRRFWVGVNSGSSGDRCAITLPGSMPPDCLILLTRTRTPSSMQWRSRRTARF